MDSQIVVIRAQGIWDTIARQNLKEESARDRGDDRQHRRKITEGILDHLIESSKVELAIVEDMVGVQEAVVHEQALLIQEVKRIHYK